MKRILLSLNLLFFISQCIFAQTYDLLGPVKDVGHVITEVKFGSDKTDMKTRLKAFNFEMDGTMTDWQVVYKDVVNIISDREIIFELEEELSTYNLTLDGKTSKEKDKSTITGKEFGFVKAKEKWALKDPRKVKKNQIEELNEVGRIVKTYFYPIESVFPNNVKIGDTWEIKDDALAPIATHIAQITGTATLTLEDVEITDNDTIAVIKYEAVYKDTQPDTKISYQLKGKVKRSIKDYNSYTIEATGQYSSTIDSEEQGMKARVTTKGDFKLDTRRTFIFKE